MRILVQLQFLALVLLSLSVSANSKESELKVVTSFTILEDLVRELGGSHVEIINLVPRDSDAHMYQPVPSDSIAIATADLVIFNGLGFEGWIDRLLDEVRDETYYLVASEGVSALRRFGEVDPHAWQSFKNIEIYVNNITNMLIKMMPENEEELIDRRIVYLKSTRDLERNIANRIARIPRHNRIVVTSHDAFGYLGHEFQIEFLAPLGLSLDAEASAEDVALVIDQIRDRGVKALFIENINNPKLLQMISEESGVAIGGLLYSDALSDLEGPAATYLDMMRHNLESLIEAFEFEHT